jgi:hypothetical protein
VPRDRRERARHGRQDGVERDGDGLAASRGPAFGEG